MKISFHPRDIKVRLAKAYNYLMHGKVNAAEISCPTLCMAGEAESGITLRIARENLLKSATPAKEMAIFTQEQGGETHCQVDNIGLPNQVMFDWLDNVLPPI